MTDLKNIFNLNNQVAIVTGGYGHLGAAMVDALLSFGAKVVVAGHSEENFYGRFKEYPNGIVFFKYCDILDSKTLKTLFAGIYHQFGRIDILINNATDARGNDPEDMNDDDWSYSIEAVLGSVHKAIREVIPYMKKQNKGKIINISSMYGVVSPDFNLYEGDNCEKYFNPSHYGAAKAGLIQLSKYYATYLGKFNIHVNSVTPGPFPSISIQKENPKFINRLKAKNPLGKIGKPIDLAGISILLSSEASDFITGQNFIVDGGWTVI